MSSRQLLNLFVLIAALVLSGSSSQVQAQVLKGQILGTVMDTSGAIIPAAKVTLTETKTNVVRSGQSNESGLYVFPNLDPGTYAVKVELEGFNIAVRDGVDLLPNTTARINLELQPGAVTETVFVTGAPPLLQTDRSDTGAKLETKQLAGDAAVVQPELCGPAGAGARSRPSFPAALGVLQFAGFTFGPGQRPGPPVQ